MSEQDSTDLFQVVGHEFLKNAPEGWVTGEITYRHVGTVYQGGAVALDANGQFMGGRPTKPMMRALEGLRELMAQPGKGAWFTAVCRLTAPGKITFDFDYDDEPAWEPAISVGHYLEEWEKHPREAANTPAWLAERLAQAQEWEHQG